MAEQAPEWLLAARCADLDPEIFFPSDGLGVQQAIAICTTCTVRTPCLEYALEHGISMGVWGGESERSRRRIKAARRKDVQRAR